MLLSHKHFDLSSGPVVDVMHCVFLGVVGKTLMNYWLDPAHRSKPFSIRKKVFYTYSLYEVIYVYTLHTYF